MSVVPLHLIFVTLVTFILLVNGNPVDSSEKYEIVVCPENGCKEYKQIYKHSIKDLGDDL